MIFRAMLLLVVLASFSAHAENVMIEDAFSPHQGAAQLITRVIAEANSSIEVAAYTFTSTKIAWALIDAAKRGVDVRVVVDKRQNGRRRLVNFMLRHHVPVRINDRYAVMHNKFMVIDGTTLELGSFNYTRSAEERNAENVLVIRNEPRVIGDYEVQWKRLWNESEDCFVNSNAFETASFRRRPE